MEFESLPPNERAARYRQKANEQVQLAAGADTPDIRASSLELAAMWMRLAEAAERGVVESAPRRACTDELDQEASG